MARIRLLEKELAVQALAEQPALHVREGDDDGVDRARLDVGSQLVEAQHECDLMPLVDKDIQTVRVIAPSHSPDG